MKVAVLMSTYNGEKFVREQIDSILAQSGDFQLDLWVRDDSSKDRTVAILREYEENGKIHWYAGNNLKPAHSFLDLVKHCTGYDYYAFADQDDVWMPNKVSKGVVELMNLLQPSLYFSDAVLVNHMLQFLGRNVYTSTPKTDFYSTACAGGFLGCTMVFNKQLAELVQKKKCRTL